MPRLRSAPHLFLATLWADWLGQSGIAASVQRPYGSAIAGEIPPDQAGPEVWVDDAADLPRAAALLDALAAGTPRHWRCPGCGETVDGPFETCWCCGAAMP